MVVFFFFFNDTATTEIYTLSLHDALPIWTIFGARETKGTRFPVHGGRLRAVRAVDVSQHSRVGIPRRLGCRSRTIPHLPGSRARDPRLAADASRVRRRSRDPVGRGT